MLWFFENILLWFLDIQNSYAESSPGLQPIEIFRLLSQRLRARASLSQIRQRLTKNLKKNQISLCKPQKATILNRRHVLTEVDCCKLIKKSSRQKSSNLFELAASDGRFRYDIRADQLQLQPNGDFCLIRLDSDILYSSMSKPVCYPKAGFHFAS